MYLRLLLLGAVIAVGGQATNVSANSIVDIAVSDSNFSSLVEAVVSQDLADTLANDGPFTVFAPTDDAFAKLPNYAVRALENNPDLLTDILLYHVVPGKLLAEDVLSNRRLSTAQGEELRVIGSAFSPYVNFSRIVGTDIVADNGVIHVIDNVLIPRSVRQALISDLRNQLRQKQQSLRELRTATLH